MTYCNERNGELLSSEDLKRRINTSFPDDMPEVCGWHLVDEVSLYPSLSEGQTAIQDKVIQQDGKWMRTYLIKEPESISQSDNYIEEDIHKKYATLEKALSDIAYIVSNLEMERMERAEKEVE